MNPYPKFTTMIATSTVVMFGLMYLNTYALDHIFFSETRAYVALVMGATIGAGADTMRRLSVPLIGGLANQLHPRVAHLPGHFLPHETTRHPPQTENTEYAEVPA